MYEALTNSYYEANSKSNKRNEGKIYNYSLLNRDFTVNKTGKCENVSHRYDPCYDYNIVSFTDVDTKEKYSVCQFFIELKEIF